MPTIRFKVNYIHSIEKGHYVNFAIVHCLDFTTNKFSNPDRRRVQLIKRYKNRFIGTKILLKNQKFFSIPLDSVKGVKYKYTIRKYIKRNWGIRIKDMKIKHINNYDNNHNYLVLISRLNKVLSGIPNMVTQISEINWRTLYENFIPKTPEQLNNIYMYNHLPGLETLNITDTLNIKMKTIYSTISKMLL